MLKDQKGAAIVEFAVVAPIILSIFVGTMQLGWFLNSYIILANATEVGARYFATQAGSSTAYINTKNQVITSASGLNTANLVITTSVADTSCTDPNCGTALVAKQGQTSKVTVTYNNFTPLLLGSLYSMPKTLSYSTQERVLGAPR